MKSKIKSFQNIKKHMQYEKVVYDLKFRSWAADVLLYIDRMQGVWDSRDW